MPQDMRDVIIITVKRNVTPELVCTVTLDAVPPTTDTPGAERIVFRDRESYMGIRARHIVSALTTVKWESTKRGENIEETVRQMP